MIRIAKGKEKAYKLADGGGLYVFVATTGVKSWRYDFQLHGKRLTATIGKFPMVSLSDARKAHEEARKAIEQGIDPRPQKATTNELANFEHWYQQATKSLGGVSKQGLSESTMQKREMRMRKYIFPHFGHLGMEHIKRDLILETITCADTSHSTKERLISYVAQTFDYFYSLKSITSANPAAGLAKLLSKGGQLEEPQNRHHTTDPNEMAKVIRGIKAYTGDPLVRWALMLAPHVFLRPANVRVMEWSWVHFDAGLIVIPANSMKMRREHKVPLTKQTAKILKEAREITGGGQYVFINLTTGKPFSDMTFQKVLRQGLKDQAGQPIGYITSFHGFRHFASTRLEERPLSFDRPLIEAQLAHEKRDRVERVYSKSERLEERAEMLARWSNWLDEIEGAS
jgi:integrase